MHHLGTFAGTGMLLSKGRECGPVTYRIDVYLDGNLKGGEGTLSGDFLMFMREIKNAPHELRLKDGQEMGIAITRANDDGAEIVTSGPIPGF